MAVHISNPENRKSKGRLRRGMVAPIAQIARSIVNQSWSRIFTNHSMDAWFGWRRVVTRSEVLRCYRKSAPVCFVCLSGCYDDEGVPFFLRVWLLASRPLYPTHNAHCGSTSQCSSTNSQSRGLGTQRETYFQRTN